VRAGAFVVSKTDLAPHLECDVDRLTREAAAINPEIRVLRLSAKTGEGMDEWTAWLKENAAAKGAG